ncbi:MAG: hypothetical protein HOQ16_12840, partial [Gemmatimonadaceae bacterium]|nr:hypothetical protein [Gemmatimonadaceae bacterium]
QRHDVRLRGFARLDGRLGRLVGLELARGVGRLVRWVIGRLLGRLLGWLVARRQQRRQRKRRALIRGS